MTNLKAIDKRIATVTTNAAKLNGYIHETGMMIVRHANQHGDCTRALALVKAMPASMRRTMLIAWFAKFTPIAVKLGDSEAVGFNAKYLALKTPEAKAKAWNIDGANAEPFYAMAEAEPEAKEYTLSQLIAMVGQLSKRIKGKIAGGEVAANDTAKASELVAKIEAIAA